MRGLAGKSYPTIVVLLKLDSVPAGPAGYWSDRIPVMGFDQCNVATRFIVLVDRLYDNAVKLIASAAAEPDALYQASDCHEASEFKRTASP
jgi:predicted ATPase